MKTIPVYLAMLYLGVLGAHAPLYGAESAPRIPEAAHSTTELAEAASNHRPLDRWMERLWRDDPEEYERLRVLREQDPEGFRDALRERLSELRRTRRMPSESEPGERRRRPGHSRAGRFAPPPTPPMPRDPYTQRIEKIERVLADLADRYRASEENRPAVKEEIRAQLNVWLDLKHEQTAWRIQQAEAQLERLRRTLETGHERRDTILERRLLRLLRAPEE